MAVIKQLSNLRVQRVDLVERAAVRDPDHPDQPARFIVWKSESAPTPHQMPSRVTSTTSADAYAEIVKAAEWSQRDNETTEQAITRVASERPDLRERYRQGQIEVSKSDEPADVRRREASATLERLIEAEVRRSHVTKAQASVRVIESEPGRSAWRILKGDPEPDKPRAPISKASGPLHEIEAKASDILRSGKAMNYADAVALVAKREPQLYARYVEAMRQQSWEAHGNT